MFYVYMRSCFMEFFVSSRLIWRIIYFQANRNSWPFKEAVDPMDNPKYYEAVKEPMGEFRLVENQMVAFTYILRIYVSVTISLWCVQT